MAWAGFSLLSWKENQDFRWFLFGTKKAHLQYHILACIFQWQTERVVFLTYSCSRLKSCKDSTFPSWSWWPFSGPWGKITKTISFVLLVLKIFFQILQKKAPYLPLHLEQILCCPSGRSTMHGLSSESWWSSFGFLRTMTIPASLVSSKSWRSFWDLSGWCYSGPLDP